MSVSVHSPAAEDLGKLLARVQDDLQYLKATAARAHDGELDPEALELAISRTEKGVAAAAERVLTSSQNQVVSLPTVSRRQPSKPMAELVESVNKRSTVRQARLASHKSALSPGKQAQVERVSHMISRPSHPLTRGMLTAHYGLPPSGEPGSRGRANTGAIVTGGTVNTLTSLPRANRRDAQLTPPAIGESDAQKGLLSLLERGLIPPAADIVLSPPAIQPKQLALHPASIAHVRGKVAEGSDLTGVRLDNKPSVERWPIHLPGAGKISLSSTKGEGVVSTKTIALPDLPARARPGTPPGTPTRARELLDCKLVVQNGCIVDGVKEFSSFKRAHQSKWQHIKTGLACVEDLCRDYAVPMALLSGHRVVKMGLHCELGLWPTTQNILDTLLNRDEVYSIITTPGRRYKGYRGPEAAAAKIQATYRMSVKRRLYLEYRRRKWAAGVVGLSWVVFMKLVKIREQLKKTRSQQLVRHHQRAAILRRRWGELMLTRRTVVHIPSLGYAQSVRSGLSDFNTCQSLQLSRLCDLRDPNVEVIYISPISVDQAVLDYYLGLLSLDGHNVRERVHIITPENMNSFGGHSLSLSTLLLYSRHALGRLTNLLKGKEAYIVPGVVAADDISLADKLDLPIYGPDHEITGLYSTRGGFKRIFNDAKVDSPPCEGEIFSFEQLVDRLSGLIVNHPLVTRWLLKLPQHVRGKGFAYCDVPKHLTCYSWLVHEAQRYGDKWVKKWAQEKALKLVTAEVPSILTNHVHPLDSAQFSGWSGFLAVFLKEGGLVEGSPPSDSVTSISVDMLIDPTGVINTIATRDQILSAPYTVWGSCLPQCSVSPALLETRAHSVALECKSRGIIGHFSIDFLTFINPDSGDQELWAVDLDLGLSDHTVLVGLASYITGGSVTSTGQLTVAGEQRFAVLSPHLVHSNLTPLYYPTFFQICRAHLIQFDPTAKKGTVFTLVDAQHRQWLGMLCIDVSHVEALRRCSLNLSTLHQEISTPQMPGESNFQAASSELDSIAELIDYNQTLT